MIFDTNALSAALAGDALIDGLLSKSSIYVPAIVLGEVLAGMPGTKLRTAYLAWIDANIDNDDAVLNVTRFTARHYGDIWNELRAIGKPIPQNDLWIAALAREHNMPIVSRDAHFDVVPGLKRLGW